ncbi:MAG: hypothetical protein RBR01_00010 [Desulfobacterales bacterium]|nr:hypothetical protein [Desulfobacterales bacterium]
MRKDLAQEEPDTLIFRPGKKIVGIFLFDDPSIGDKDNGMGRPPRKAHFMGDRTMVIPSRTGLRITSSTS